MTNEEIYENVMGHEPNKEFGLKGSFSWDDIDALMTAVKNCSIPDPALKLAGKMAMAAETVINSKITTVSVAIAMLEDAVNEYNNEIFSRQ